jgi:hypothetical protein
MDAWRKFGERFGFPAMVAMFVLWRLDNRLAGIEKALRELALALGAHVVARGGP